MQTFDWLKCGMACRVRAGRICRRIRPVRLTDLAALPQALKDSPAATSVQLEPFSLQETEQFVAQRLGDVALAGDQMAMLAAAVWGKAAGLPLYADQMVARLHDQVALPCNGGTQAFLLTA